MAKFKVGDRVRHAEHSYQWAEVLSVTDPSWVGEPCYWIKLDVTGRKAFALESQLTSVDEVIPNPETPDGGTPEPRLNYFAQVVHKANAKWWVNPETGQPVERNVGEMLMLVVSELAEAMEGHRKGLMDTHLPHQQMFDVEIIDTLIRLFDIAGGLEIDLDCIFREKMEYNVNRPDHSLEARREPGGKRY